MPKAFILGGSGQIGRAVATRLLAADWEVVAASRHPSPDLPSGCDQIAVDRHAPGTLASALGCGADLLIDCIAYDAADAMQLLELTSSVGRFCAISSASVYRDDEGRSLVQAQASGFPELPVPITETQPTVSAGDANYATRKIAMEQALLDGAAERVTILRPCAIYGPGSRSAREWWFVKRLLDGRRHIPVAYGGESRFHTTAVEAIAAAVMVAARPDAPAIMNVVDPIAPTVAEIGAAIMVAVNRSATIVGLPDQGYPPSAGATPWTVPRPFVCAPHPAIAPVGDYQALVGPAVHDVIERTSGKDWRSALPGLAAYPWNLFDYEADDRALAAAR